MICPPVSGDHPSPRCRQMTWWRSQGAEGAGGAGHSPCLASRALFLTKAPQVCGSVESPLHPVREGKELCTRQNAQGRPCSPPLEMLTQGAERGGGGGDRSTWEGVGLCVLGRSRASQGHSRTHPASRGATLTGLLEPVEGLNSPLPLR